MHALLLSCLAIINFSGFIVQSSTSTPAHIRDRAIIQRRRTVLVRSAKLAKQFPERRTAIVSYPVITGLNPVVLRKVRALLAFKSIFDYSLDEYRNDAWLTEFNYAVDHNSNHLLDITFTQSGVAAYPDEQEKHFLINLRNGALVKAADAFQSDKLQDLAALVDNKLQREIEERKNDESLVGDDPSEKASISEGYETLKFEIKELDDFSVTKKGVTFLYDAGFPHVIKALEPEGRYFFTYKQLKPYILLDGPLGQFVR